MKSLVFPPSFYSKDRLNAHTYLSKEDSAIGCLELLWSTVEYSTLTMDKKAHKINKRLKSKLREITIYKDAEKNSRICTADSAVSLILEEDEIELVIKHMTASQFLSRYSDDVDLLWNIIDEAKEYKIVTLTK